MNCKPGDLAVVTVSKGKNLGKVVTCIRLATKDELDKHLYESDRPVWIVDRQLETSWGQFLPFAPDACLRPIRPGEGQDETLTWAGKPEKVAA